MVGPLFEFDVRVTGDEAEVAGRALQLIPHPVPGILGPLEQHGGETSWRWCRSWALKSEGLPEGQGVEQTFQQRPANAELPAGKSKPSAGNCLHGPTQASSSVALACVRGDACTLESAFLISAVVQKHSWGQEAPAVLAGSPGGSGAWL